MVPYRKKMDCFLLVGTEFLPQAKEFKYLWGFCTKKGKYRRNQQPDQCCVSHNDGVVLEFFGSELEGKAISPVGLQSNPHLWS